MKNHAVTQHAPPLPRKQGHEIFFDPQGRGRGGQPKPCRQPRHVGVHHNADVDAKSIPQNHIRGFSRHAGKRNQRFKFLRNITVMVLHQLLRGSVQEFGFVSVQSNGSDVLPNGFW